MSSWWKATTTTIDAGTSLRFASTATNETVVLFVDGTANEGVTLAPQTAGGAYLLTVSGYASDFFGRDPGYRFHGAFDVEDFAAAFIRSFISGI